MTKDVMMAGLYCLQGTRVVRKEGRDIDIWNKIAIVTGAAVGIGQAISERLATEGATVVLTDVNEREGTETLHRIRAAGGQAAFRKTDVTHDSEVQALVDFAIDTFGGLDILVNNAGGGGHIPPHFPEASPLQWSKVLDLNLRAPLLATQLALSALRRRGAGVVINIGSTAGLGLDDYQSPEYAAARAGLIRATSCLTHLHKTCNVRVNCIVPDWVATDRALQELTAMSEHERSELAPLVPLSHLCQEVVALIEDEHATGRVVVLWRGQPAHTLAPGLNEILKQNKLEAQQ